ncbi:MAG: hypothetical protein ACOZAO_05285 [Patescibacteria group bacterium]
MPKLTQTERDKIISNLIAKLGFEQVVEVKPLGGNLPRFQVRLKNVGGAVVTLMPSTSRVSISFEARAVSPGFRLYYLNGLSIGDLISSY